MSKTRLPLVRGMRWTQIDKIATRLIRKTYPRLLKKPGPFPVKDFLEFKLHVIGFDWEIRELPHGKEAEMDPQNRLIILSEETYLDLHAGDRRARFTVMHEIGHAILHAAYLREVLSDGRGAMKLNRSGIPPFRDPECQANTFAAAILMPTCHILEMVDDGGDVRQVYNTFEVSWTAASNRLEGLHRFV